MVTVIGISKLNLNKREISMKLKVYFLTILLAVSFTPFDAKGFFTQEAIIFLNELVGDADVIYFNDNMVDGGETLQMKLGIYQEPDNELYRMGEFHFNQMYQEENVYGGVTSLEVKWDYETVDVTGTSESSKDYKEIGEQSISFPASTELDDSRIYLTFENNPKSKVPITTYNNIDGLDEGDATLRSFYIVMRNPRVVVQFNRVNKGNYASHRNWQWEETYYLNRQEKQLGTKSFTGPGRKVIDFTPHKPLPNEIRILGVIRSER